jgi:hypothetical protein
VAVFAAPFVFVVALVVVDVVVWSDAAVAMWPPLRARVSFVITGILECLVTAAVAFAA